MTRWAERIDWELEAIMYVDFELDGREVHDYAVVLAIAHDGKLETVRVYDGAHGVNEMHRHTRTGGKQPATPFHSATLGEGMRAAIAEIRRGYRQMIEAWRA